MASDGLWDFLSDDEAVAIVADCIQKNNRVGKGKGSCLIFHDYMFVHLYCTSNMHSTPDLNTFFLFFCRMVRGQLLLLLRLKKQRHSADSI